MFQWLDYLDWQNACSLLEYQFERKNDNLHFNTLSFFCYEQQGWSNSLDELKTKNYFETFVKTGVLLTDENEVFSIHYPGRKGIAKYRNTVFLSFKLRLLYYAVGLAIARKLNLQEIPSSKGNAYFGGLLEFDEKGLFKRTPPSVYYKDHYKSFRSICLNYIEKIQRNEDLFSVFSFIPKDYLFLVSVHLIYSVQNSLSPQYGYHMCVIVLDIENFYDQIDYTVFNERVFKNPKLKAQECLQTSNFLFSFSELLKLMVHQTQGLPQTCNDVVSSFLSWVYLFEFDQQLESFLQDNFEKAYWLRYCDDIHIFIEYQENAESPKDIAFKVITECKRLLYENYKLKLNSKTIYYDLQATKDLEAYKKTLKQTSFAEDLPLENDEDYEESHFSEWSNRFSTGLQQYLRQDLIKEPSLIGDLSDHLKLFYHKKFGLKLRESLILALSPLLGNDPSLHSFFNKMNKMIYSQPCYDNYRKMVSELKEKLHSNVPFPHLLEKPKLFVFLASCDTSIHQGVLDQLELLDETAKTCVSVDFLMDLKKQFQERAFTYYNSGEKVGLEHLIALRNFYSAYFTHFNNPLRKKFLNGESSYTYFHLSLEQCDKNNISYLPVFSVQRRNAELLGHYDRAISYLNSELCILLTLLQFPKKTPSENIPHSLDNFKISKESSYKPLTLREDAVTPFRFVADMRSNIDVTHNSKSFPNDSNSRTFGEIEYYDLKGKIVAPIIEELNKRTSQTCPP
ncbi:MAG: RNA-directed DNA polymerase [Vampirovibrionales bacterium]